VVLDTNDLLYMRIPDPNRIRTPDPVCHNPLHREILVMKMCVMEEEFGSYIDSQGFKRCRFCGEIWGKQNKGDEE